MFTFQDNGELSQGVFHLWSIYDNPSLILWRIVAIIISQLLVFSRTVAYVKFVKLLANYFIVQALKVILAIALYSTK